MSAEVGSNATCSFAYTLYPEMGKPTPASISTIPLSAAPDVGISYGVKQVRYFLGSNESDAAIMMFMAIQAGDQAATMHNYDECEKSYKEAVELGEHLPPGDANMI